MRTYSKQLHHMDPYWELDDLVMKQLLGEDGIHLMKKRWEDDVIPKVPANAKVSESLEKSKLLLASQGTVFATAPVKAELGVAHGMLERIQSGEAMLQSDDVSDWVGAMAKKLELFVSFVPGKKKAGGAAASSGEVAVVEDKGILYGVQAVQAMVRDFKSQAPASLEALRPLATWRHLLSDDEARAVAKWRDDILKKSTETASSGVRAAPKSKPAKACKKKEQGEQDLTAAALAMLKMPSKQQ